MLTSPLFHLLVSFDGLFIRSGPAQTSSPVGHRLSIEVIICFLGTPLRTAQRRTYGSSPRIFSRFDFRYCLSLVPLCPFHSERILVLRLSGRGVSAEISEEGMVRRL